jgi:hypothetical protein
MVLTCVVEHRRYQAQMRNHDCIPFAPDMRLRRMQHGIRVGGNEKSVYEKLSDSVQAAVPQPERLRCFPLR